MNVYIEPIIAPCKGKDGGELVGLVIARPSGVTFAVVKSAKTINADKAKLAMAWTCLRNNSEVLKVKLKTDINFTVTKYLTMRQLLESEFSRLKSDKVTKVAAWDPMQVYRDAIDAVGDQQAVIEAMTAGGSMVCPIKFSPDDPSSSTELVMDSPFEFMNLFNRFKKRWASIRSEQRTAIFAKLYKSDKSVSTVLEEHFSAGQYNQLTKVDDALLTSCEAIQHGILGFLAMTISVAVRRS